ncbi:MAG: hypothetical protein PHS95_01075 [Candidatus Pacebacteria bacterium]|nr:hypothetical protein [Candidatus Paceibacterota bacterium]
MGNKPSEKDILYTALFVVDPEKLISKFAPKHSKVFAHHSTIEFKPASLKGIEVGKLVKIKIIGRAFDENGDALLVENAKSKNKYPHITISCAENIPPTYSNELLEKASKNGTLEMLKEPFFVEATEGYSDSAGNVVLS